MPKSLLTPETRWTEKERNKDRKKNDKKKSNGEQGLCFGYIGEMGE